MNVEVVIDPQLTQAATPGFTCPVPAENTVCDPRTANAAMRPGSVGDRITFTLGEMFFPVGTMKVVEIDATTRRARVCNRFYTDHIALVCHDMPVTCSASGTLTLPKIPESAPELATMAYRLDVPGLIGAF